MVNFNLSIYHFSRKNNYNQRIINYYLYKDKKRIYFSVLLILSVAIVLLILMFSVFYIILLYLILCYRNINQLLPYYSVKYICLLNSLIINLIFHYL